MDILRAWLARMVAFVRRRTRDEDFDRELSSHLDLAIQANLRRGLSADDARREAPMRLGGMQLLLVAAAACLVPALRATRVDPAVVLRSE